MVAPNRTIGEEPSKFMQTVKEINDKPTQAMASCLPVKDGNAVFVEIPWEYAVNKKLVLLVHSGADACLIKRSALLDSVRVNHSERKTLGGAFGGSERTQGSVKIKHDILMVLNFNLHVVGNNTELPADGVLGRDNM